MKMEEVFNDIIFPKLKKYVEDNSKYSTLVTNVQTLQSKVFPIVTVRLTNEVNHYNNLNYGEKTYSFSITIDVYAQDMDIEETAGTVKKSKRTICNYITELILKYFEDNYRLSIRTEYDVINVDSNIHRNSIKLTGTLDTKYEDRLYIYPY